MLPFCLPQDDADRRDLRVILTTVVLSEASAFLPTRVFASRADAQPKDLGLLSREGWRM